LPPESRIFKEEKPVGVTGVIIFLVIILAGGYYIYTVNRVGKLDGIARNLAGEIDTLLWDRNHVYEQITELLSGKGIELEEDLTKKQSLGLGMPTAMQMATYTEQAKRWNRLLPVLEEHPELESDEDYKRLRERFDSIRTDLIATGSKHNRAATDFNSYIGHPLSGFIASRKTKGERAPFSVELAEATAKS